MKTKLGNSVAYKFIGMVNWSLRIPTNVLLQKSINQLLINQKKDLFDGSITERLREITFPMKNLE
jgi:hypothetical protein